MRTKRFALASLLVCAVLALGACTPVPPASSTVSGDAPASQAPADASQAPDNTDAGTPAAPALSDEITPVTIISSGWVNVPFSEPDDPFRTYLKEKFKIDATVLSYAGTDFEQQLSVMLASNQKPDIINATRQMMLNYYDQQALIEDWTPYLDQMPRVKANMERDEMYLNQAKGENGMIRYLFANADVPQWCLKVRRDWIDAWAQENGKAAGYDLANSDDVLSFARWVRDSQNEDPNNLKVYAFTSSGSGTSIGTSLEWTQMMFGHTINGLGNAPAQGFYVAADGTVSNPVIDGTFEPWLNFVKTLYDEKLIHPDWFTMDWGTKGGQLYDGKAAFDWYPGVIVEETMFNNKDKPETNNGLDTYDWWDNMDVPANAGNTFQGIPTGAQYGHIWSVSYETSMDPDKMNKICALLDDVTMAYDESATDQAYFDRPESYDKLRWAVDVLDEHVYNPIEGSKLVVCNTDPGKDEGKPNYRADHPGTWDWGSWFSCNADGVVQASTVEPDKVKFSEKVGVLNDATNLKQYFCPGSMFTYDTAKLQAMFDAYVQFTYQYVTGANTQSVDQFIQKWRTELEGDTMIEEATKQFKELGFIE